MDNAMEQVFVTNAVIKAFERRGWGLYPVGRGPVMFTSVEMVMEVVSFGREEEMLESGMRYMLLPLLKDSTDRWQMCRAIEAMAIELRMPYFVNLKSTKDGVEVLGRHLIDTVEIDSPFLNFHTDTRFQQVTTDNTIEVHLAGAVTTILKQVTMAFRAGIAPEEVRYA